MKIETHQINNTTIAEVISNRIIIENAADGIDLLGNLYYQGFDKIIWYQQNITPSFFDLKNQMAGDILQKFSTYGVRLSIVGNFDTYTQESKSLHDFIIESNKRKHINFVSSLSQALECLADTSNKKV
jgi:hypothetical protein